MVMTLHPTVATVTDRIRQRSAPTRSTYLTRLERARANGTVRKSLSCTNLAHLCRFRRERQSRPTRGVLAEPRHRLLV